MENYDLCSGRDARGRLRFVRVKAGVARTGMFVRLVGGIFVQVERVERGGVTQEPLGAPVELLAAVWTREDADCGRRGDADERLG